MRPNRVLIVEDDILLGWTIERYLYDAGCRSVKVVTTVAEAMQTLRYSQPDVALLDLRLRGGELSLRVADALDDIGAPFAFLTGHNQEMISERHRDRPFLKKPASPKEILECLRSAVDIAHRDGPVATTPVPRRA